MATATPFRGLVALGLAMKRLISGQPLCDAHDFGTERLQVQLDCHTQSCTAPRVAMLMV